MLRKNHVEILARNPKAKPRHEAVDITSFIQTVNSNYLDIQEERCWTPYVFIAAMKASISLRNLGC